MRLQYADLAGSDDSEEVGEAEERDDDDQRLGGLQVPPVVVHRGLGVELRQHDLV